MKSLSEMEGFFIVNITKSGYRIKNKNSFTLSYCVIRDYFKKKQLVYGKP